MWANIAYLADLAYTARSARYARSARSVMFVKFGKRKAKQNFVSAKLLQGRREQCHGSVLILSF